VKLKDVYDLVFLPDEHILVQDELADVLKQRGLIPGNESMIQCPVCGRQYQYNPIEGKPRTWGYEGSDPPPNRMIAWRPSEYAGHKTVLMEDGAVRSLDVAEFKEALSSDCVVQSIQYSRDD